MNTNPESSKSDWKEQNFKLSSETAERLQQHLLRLQSLGLPTDVDQLFEAAMSWFLPQLESDPKALANFGNHVAKLRAEADNRLRGVSEQDMVYDLALSKYLTHLESADPD